MMAITLNGMESRQCGTMSVIVVRSVEMWFRIADCAAAITTQATRHWRCHVRWRSFHWQQWCRMVTQRICHLAIFVNASKSWPFVRNETKQFWKKIEKWIQIKVKRRDDSVGRFCECWNRQRSNGFCALFWCFIRARLCRWTCTLVRTVCRVVVRYYFFFFLGFLKCKKWMKIIGIKVIHLCDECCRESWCIANWTHVELAAVAIAFITKLLLQHNTRSNDRNCTQLMLRLSNDVDWSILRVFRICWILCTPRLNARARDVQRERRINYSSFSAC